MPTPSIYIYASFNEGKTKWKEEHNTSLIRNGSE